MKLVLDAAGMGFADIVKATVFLVNPVERALFSRIRSEVTGGSKHVSTLVYVGGSGGNRREGSHAVAPIR